MKKKYQQGWPRQLFKIVLLGLCSCCFWFNAGSVMTHAQTNPTPISLSVKSSADQKVKQSVNSVEAKSKKAMAQTIKKGRQSIKNLWQKYHLIIIGMMFPLIFILLIDSSDFFGSN